MVADRVINDTQERYEVATAFETNKIKSGTCALLHNMKHTIIHKMQIQPLF